MTFVEIYKINIKSDNKNLSFDLEAPKIGEGMDFHAIRFKGRVKFSDNRELKSLMISDVSSGITTISPVNNSGGGEFNFDFLISLLGFPRDFELVIQSIMKNGSFVVLATVEGARQFIHSSFQPLAQPLMLTSMGRTGTTMMMKVLSSHPAIVAHKLHPYETRVASYWMEFLRTLLAPSSESQGKTTAILAYLKKLLGGKTIDKKNRKVSYEDIKYWIGFRYLERMRVTKVVDFLGYLAMKIRQRPTQITTHKSMPRISKLLGGWLLKTGRDPAQIATPESMAGFCQKNLEDFYRNVAFSQNQILTSYFVEKFRVTHIPWMLWELYPNAREIILVRDFRDMLCSINAFNDKRGKLGFGREKVDNEEDFVLKLSQGISKLYRAWQRRQDSVYLLRYEDVILKPVDTIKNMLKYLNLDDSDHIVQGMLSAANHNDSQTIGHRTSSTAEESIGRWKKDLSPSLQSLCDREFGHILKAFGYYE